MDKEPLDPILVQLLEERDAERKAKLQVRNKKAYEKHKDSVLERHKQYYREHQDKAREYGKRYYEEHPEVSRRASLKWAHGITPEEYDELLAKQEGKCAICGRGQDDLPRRLAVDHNHTTGKVRGLLCDNCNTAVGLLHENLLWTQKMLDYLTGGNPI